MHSYYIVFERTNCFAVDREEVDRLRKRFMKLDKVGYRLILDIVACVHISDSAMCYIG